MSYAILTYCHYMCQNNGVWMKTFNFQKGRIFIVFIATELHSGALFFQFFAISSISGYNIKTKNYKRF